jgi:hypothetical protein
VAECGFCQTIVREKDKKGLWGGQVYHLKCLRKIRRIAKRKKFGGIAETVRSLERKQLAGTD